MIATHLTAGIAIVELDDYRRLSAFDPVAGLRLHDCLRALSDDDAVRVIVLASRAPDFCPPLDAPPRTADRAAVHAAYASASGLYQTLCYSPKVVIAAVQGRCSGAGSALLLCADLAVASEDVSIASPFGTIPQASYVLAALTMRMARAKAWCLGEQALDSRDAMECGMVNRVAPRAVLMAESLKLARGAARMPLDGIRISKVMMETYLDSQGVGKEFDHAGFYGSMLEAAAPRDVRS